MLGCPFSSDGTVAGGNPSNGNGCANRQSISPSSDDREEVQTARIELQHRRENMTWFRFQSRRLRPSRPLYTDPINPPVQRLLSAAPLLIRIGHTHAFFRAHLVNGFNPAFSWYESLFGPPDFQKTLAAFPIVLHKQAAPMRPSPHWEGSTIRGCRDKALRASSSMTTSPGRSCRMNSGSEPTAASSV